MRRSLDLAWQRAQEGQTSLLFVDSQQAASYCREVEQYTRENQIPVLACALDKARLEAPYSPFLPLIAKLIEGRQQELPDLLTKATEYIPCRDLLLDYLLHRPVQRHELPLLDDLRFEQQEMYQTLGNLLKLLIDQPMLFAIADAQRMGVSGAKFLRWLADEAEAIPIAVVMQLDCDAMLNRSVEQTEWANFVSWLEQEAVMISLPRTADATDCRWPCWEPAPQRISEQHQLLQAQLHLLFFAWDDAVRLLNAAMKTMEQDESRWRHAQRLLGDAYLYLGQWDDALAIYESLLDSQSVMGLPDLQADLSCQISLTHVARQDFETALQCASSAIQFANQAGNSALLARCWFALYYGHDKSTTPIEVGQFHSLIQLLEQNQLYNQQIYALRNSYVMLRFFDSITEAEVSLMIRRAINLARSRGHLPAVAASYQARGILYSYNFQYRRTLRCFRVSERIRSRYRDPLDLIRIRNGIGHFYTLLEDHHQALRYFSLAFFEARKQHNYSEMLVTLFNFSWLYYKSRHYQRAAELLEAIQRLANSRRMTHFPFRNMHDIYSLKGLCHFKLGELSRAQQCLERLQRLGFKASQTGDFLSRLLQGMMIEAVGDLDNAVLAFRNAPDKLGLFRQADKHILPQAHYEQARVLYKLERHNELQQVLAEGCALCREMQMVQSSSVYESLLCELKAGKPLNFEPGPEALPVVRFELDELLALAEAEEKLDHAHRRMREINLVNRLQGLVDRHYDLSELADETLRMVCIAFAVQSGYIYRKQEQDWEIVAEIDGGSHEAETQEELLQLLLKAPRPHVRNKICRRGQNGTRNVYQSHLLVPMIQEGQLSGALILNAYESAVLFNNNDLSVLELIGNQLASQMSQLIYRSRLVKMSTTDSLTRLYNRQAVQLRLQEELQGLARSASGRMCLAFIDLDNFKYINDSFGHDAGDLLLESFSGMLGEVLRSSDVAARWGGDEFIVLLPGLCQAQAAQVGERILAALHEKQHFLPAIEKHVGHAIEVPETMRLNCSIGVAVWQSDQQPHKSDKQLLKEADQALYQAKRKGKGCVVASATPERSQALEQALVEDA